MTPESLAYVSLVFKMFDTDGDGLITRKDTRNILKKMGYKGTSEQVRVGIWNFILRHFFYHITTKTCTYEREKM